MKQTSKLTGIHWFTALIMGMVYTYNKNHLERGGFYHFSFLQKIVPQE